ncbi:hypothetical protein GRI44_00655 [Altererythrobacter confluentis]|uniref:Uncharacterized protein n=1 Tax=Allopontixanthobacter confluentis TaxID=1849021 RepID=A0A6L7GDS4_9SPHN|nr:hypothetical protein [Allopontixanthobacter confluentis]MXP13268.1 hypothetical protein [Allopontixanthobacter confluentis]
MANGIANIAVFPPSMSKTAASVAALLCAVLLGMPAQAQQKMPPKAAEIFARAASDYDKNSDHDRNRTAGAVPAETAGHVSAGPANAGPDTAVPAARPVPRQIPEANRFQENFDGCRSQKPRPCILPHMPH